MITKGYCTIIEFIIKKSETLEINDLMPTLESVVYHLAV